MQRFHRVQAGSLHRRQRGSDHRWCGSLPLSPAPLPLRFIPELVYALQRGSVDVLPPGFHGSLDVLKTADEFLGRAAERRRAHRERQGEEHGREGARHREAHARERRGRSREFGSDLGQLTEMRRLVREACQTAWGASADPEMLHRIELALQEAASNIIRHAFDGSCPQVLELLAEVDANELRLLLLHRGRDFDPSAIQPPSFDGTAPCQSRTSTNQDQEVLNA